MLIQSAQRLSLLLLLKLEEVVVLSHNVPVAAGVVQTASTAAALMIGLAVGIDYTLFIVERVREERVRVGEQAGGH